MSNEIPKTAGIVSMRYIVMSVLNRMRQYSMQNYEFLMQICIEEYTRMNLWHLDNVEVVYLTMSSAKVVSLPADFVDWLKIGIPVNGKLRVITRHDKLLLPRAFQDGTEVGNADETGSLDTILFVDHFRAGQFVAGLYGLGGGIDSAYYRFDRERNQLIFSGTVNRGQIVLEYISSGVALNGSTMIPREAVPALQAYLLWQYIDNDLNTAMNEKQRRKQNWEEEIAALEFFQSAFTKEEYMRHVYKHSKQTPKR